MGAGYDSEKARIRRRDRPSDTTNASAAEAALPGKDLAQQVKARRTDKPRFRTCDTARAVLFTQLKLACWRDGVWGTRVVMAPSEALEAVMPGEPLISIVDDDQAVRESIRRLMRSLDYTVEAFPSAADFLASPRLDETACLIADINMPAMTGVELYRHLIDSGRAVPTILITAYPDDATRLRALNDGVVGYLDKPFDENELMLCVRTALLRGKPPQENS